MEMFAAVVSVFLEGIGDVFEDHFFDFFADERDADGDATLCTSDATLVIGDDFGGTGGFYGGAFDFGDDGPSVGAFGFVPDASFHV